MHALNYFEHVTAATHISISFFLLIYFLHEYIDILLITNWKKNTVGLYDKRRTPTYELLLNFLGYFLLVCLRMELVPNL